MYGNIYVIYQVQIALFHYLIFFHNYTNKLVQAVIMLTHSVSSCFLSNLIDGARWKLTGEVSQYEYFGWTVIRMAELSRSRLFRVQSSNCHCLAKSCQLVALQMKKN